MNLTKAGIICFCIVVFCALNVFADQIDEQEMQAEFQRIDADNDGSITPEEMQTYQVKRFKELDKDKNGALDTEELKADKTGMLKNVDKNKDGEVSQQESTLQFKEYFNGMDSNKDSFVSEKEFRNYNPVVIRF